jgi:hypothetical protein
MNIHLTLIFLLISTILFAQTEVKIWEKFENEFTSSKAYEKPIYQVKEFSVTFTSNTGRKRKVNGFWDGGNTWKVRFMPDEMGEWKWITSCSDKDNAGLYNLQGNFTCVANDNRHPFYRYGAVIHPNGKYYLTYNDGTPYFWVACTAWNGALKSTDEEWEYYLSHRIKNHYNLIQLVTTQWRGADKNLEGLVAYEGSGEITIHPEFFKRIDQRIDEANAMGLLVSPVILWALPVGEGRHLIIFLMRRP